MEILKLKNSVDSHKRAEETNERIREFEDITTEIAKRENTLENKMNSDSGNCEASKKEIALTSLES